MHVQRVQILIIRENPINSLGKWYDTLSDTANQADEELTWIDKSGLPGKFKSWINHNGLLPRLMWMLTVYQIPMTSV